MADRNKTIKLDRPIHFRGVVYEGKVKVNEKLAKRLLHIQKVKQQIEKEQSDGILG